MKLIKKRPLTLLLLIILNICVSAYMFYLDPSDSFPAPQPHEIFSNGDNSVLLCNYFPNMHEENDTYLYAVKVNRTGKSTQYLYIRGTAQRKYDIKAADNYADLTFYDDYKGETTFRFFLNEKVQENNAEQ